MFVYLVQGRDSGPIKVGASYTPALRLYELRGKWRMPDLRLVAVYDGGYELERSLHAALEPWALGREWFRALGNVLVVAGPLAIPEAGS